MFIIFMMRGYNTSVSKVGEGEGEKVARVTRQRWREQPDR